MFIYQLYKQLAKYCPNILRLVVLRYKQELLNIEKLIAVHSDRKQTVNAAANL